MVVFQNEAPRKGTGRALSPITEVPAAACGRHHALVAHGPPTAQARSVWATRHPFAGGPGSCPSVEYALPRRALRAGNGRSRRTCRHLPPLTAGFGCSQVLALSSRQPGPAVASQSLRDDSSSATDEEHPLDNATLPTPSAGGQVRYGGGVSSSSFGGDSIRHSSIRNMSEPGNGSKSSSSRGGSGDSGGNSSSRSSSSRSSSRRPAGSRSARAPSRTRGAPRRHGGRRPPVAHRSRTLPAAPPRPCCSPLLRLPLPTWQCLDLSGTSAPRAGPR